MDIIFQWVILEKIHTLPPPPKGGNFLMCYNTQRGQGVTSNFLCEEGMDVYSLICIWWYVFRQEKNAENCKREDGVTIPNPQ